MTRSRIATAAVSSVILAACVLSASAEVGQEIVVCGKKVPVGAPVVLWTDPGGYDAYSLLPRFAPAESQPAEKAKPRYGSRIRRLGPEAAAKVEKDGWDLPALQSVVDQFVIHFDVCGTSRRCFQVLQDARGLSVHFMLDLDGTIYQTLDLKESAFHATKSNARSVGVEIANMGAYPVGGPNPFDRWYVKDNDGRTRITIPDELGKDSQRDKATVLRPIRDEPVQGVIRGRNLTQYDLTPQQYESLAKLTAALKTTFPLMKGDYPRDDKGDLFRDTLADDAWQNYQGVLGHFHVQTNKIDPGPAFQWGRISSR